MVVANKPLSVTARIVAGALGVLCLAAGVIGLALAIARGQLLLGVPAIFALVVGVLYTGAAWRGRPWKLR
jgi:hypothetical protein